MERTCDVIIIGAGLAGLAAAATARAAGATPLVLEAHRPGGRAQISKKDGFVFNRGGHALYRGGAGAEALAALGIAVDGARPPLGRYRMGRAGGTGRMPVDVGSLLRTPLLSWRSKARLARFLGTLPGLDAAALAGRSMAEFVADLDLAADAQGVLGALIRIGTYMADLEELGADAGVRQLQLAAGAGVAYLHGGWGPLLAALAARLEVEPGTAVRSVHRVGGRIEVRAGDEVVVAGSAVVAAGGPETARRLLGDPPDWGDLGGPVTAACLDTATRVVPTPGYLLGIDQPLYTTTQSPPARQAPPGGAVVASIRYGARNAADDRADLEAHRRAAGVEDDTIVHQRFLARMTVAATAPRPVLGGLAGRPSIGATGDPGIFLAGDWIGPRGLLADAALASGHDAGRAAAGRAAAGCAAAGRAGRAGRNPSRLAQ